MSAIITDKLFSNFVNQNSPNPINDNILFLAQQLTRNADLIPKPQVFLKSNNNNLSSNVADGVLILPGVQIPTGHRGTVEDFNVNYTTAAGTVRLVIIDANGTIITDILRDINSSINGTGKTVLEQGQALAVVGQSAGAGTFSVYCSGTIQKVI